MARVETLLKTRQVARALGVSPSTVKRWVDTGVLRACRTVGKHRLVCPDEVLRCARERGLTVVDWGALERAGGALPRGESDRQRGALLEALREGRAGEAKRLIRSAYDRAGSAAALADQVIRPVMEQIGHDWFAGALEVYHEHLATRIVTAALSDLLEGLPRPHPLTAPRAVGCAPEGDPYQVAGLLCELVLREGGWDVRNLGPNLPLRSLARAVEEYRPGLVYVTASYLANEEAFSQDYRLFHEAASARGAAVAVGGRALRPELLARLTFDGYGARMAHLEAFARRRSAAPAGGRSDRLDHGHNHTF